MNNEIHWAINPKRPLNPFVPSPRRPLGEQCRDRWRPSWVVKAAHAAGLVNLPLEALSDRLPGFSGLSQLAWNLLWLGSWGYGVRQLQSIWAPSRPGGWVKPVAREIELLLHHLHAAAAPCQPADDESLE